MAASDRGLQSVPRGLDLEPHHLFAGHQDGAAQAFGPCPRFGPVPRRTGFGSIRGVWRRIRFHAFRKRGCGRHRLTDISGRFRH